MFERCEFLRIESLRRGTGGFTSVENNYNRLRGYIDFRGQSEIYRRGYAQGFALKHATPVIDARELIVGKPCYRTLTTEEKTDYDIILSKSVPAMTPVGGQASHMAIDYAKLLRVGIAGIVTEINEYRSALNLADPENIEKDNFYLGCLAALEGLIFYAKKYNDYALSLADSETDPIRQKELILIAETLAVVPMHPAKNFRQALQCIHFVTFCLEGLYQFGRPDRYLIDYYRTDIKNGDITPDEALELITCTCILFNDYISRGLAVGLMVGGRGPDGEDMTNELTYLFLQSIAHTRMIYPGICLCYNCDTPDDLLELACDLLGKGYSHPAIFNDDIIIKGLMYYGLPFDHACEYIQSTCVEITPCHRSAVWVASPYHNLTQFLLDVLADPDIDRKCRSYKELEDLYRERLGNAIREEVITQNKLQLERRLHGGDPLVSCFVDDCLLRGRDIDNGGALYNWIMPSFVGMSNLSDSLMTIKELVFKNAEMSLSEIYTIIKANYDGNEPLRQRILNKIDKYGNDSREPDEIVQSITEWITVEVSKYKTYRGDKFIPSLFCWVMHEALGRATIATPDGRPAGFPFGDGSGPAQGREKNGPTASVLSSTKWDHYPFIGGIAVNLKFAKSVFNEESMPKLMTLIKTYIKRGGFEIQINVVDREVLIDAQKNPEQYSDLVVRIGGYSDYFIHIGKNMQDEVILRTEHVI
ncbi:MAG: pyruvate formate lyase family protein [Eubacteriales bacterium]|nr:pyruvate formate lyase family protein [Eubacteriales bacterium]